MPFNNDIAGGNGQLVRNWIQSQNYTPGVSGWRISKNGNAEFNNGTFRGSIEVGPLTGQHFIVNNTATGDVIDIYDASNRLVTSIGNTGAITTTLQPALDSALLQGNTLDFFNISSPPASRANITATSNAAGSHIIVDSGRGVNSNDAVLWLFDAISANGAKSYIRAQQKADNTHGPVTGSVVQTDTDSSVNNAIHGAAYSGMTNATGHIVFNHGCGFTPTGAVVTGNTPGATFANLTYGVNSLTATQADVNWTVGNTGAAFANTGITFYMLFWG